MLENKNVLPIEILIVFISNGSLGTISQISHRRVVTLNNINFVSFLAFFNKLQQAAAVLYVINKVTW